MRASPYSAEQSRFLPKNEFPSLIEALQEEGYTVVAPTLVDRAVTLRPIKSADDVASGITDQQGAGRYRTAEGDPEMYFQYAVGADGPKRYLFPPVLRLFQAHIEAGQFVLDEASPTPPKLALLGVRPCELTALDIQDRVRGLQGKEGQPFRCESDSYYQQARETALIIAVNCTRPGGTCFCASMGTGPAARGGFDVAMTELRAGFVLQIGSDRGLALMKKLPVRETSSADLELAELRMEQAAGRMGRELDTVGLREALAKTIDHPRWDEVAGRCLGCGNCTLVCPTCFCSSVVDSNELHGNKAARTRQWESCFTHQFSYTTGGPVRSTIRARYRHWLRHKLCTWFDQFGTSGCVGCGRCITWCPVGIDLTVEADMIRDGQRQEQVEASHPVRRKVAR